MSFPRYPRYKDSGVEWLGEVPEHWNVKRLRYAAMLNPSKSEVAHLDGSVAASFLPMEAISENGQIDLHRERSISEVQVGYTYFREGDVVLAKITPCFENGKGAWVTGLTNEIGFGTTELIVARPCAGQSDGQYLAYLFRSREFRTLGEAQMYGAGGQKRVPDSFVRDFSTALPPVLEQRAIVTLLDYETAKINALLVEQQRLIELLKEKRDAVISHAVTRGLNPDAPMKPSGVEWLGDVPAHWKIQRLSALCAFQPGKAHEPFIEDGGEFIVVNSRFVSTNGESRKYCTQNLTPAARNDILMVMSDLPNGRALAKAYFVADDGPYAVNQRVCILSPKRANARFLYHLLNRNPLFLQHDDGVNQTHLPNEVFRKFPALVPPQSEQVAIAEFLDRKAAEFDLLTAEAQRATALLQERRTALISAAVTGKIDVRNLVEAA